MDREEQVEGKVAAASFCLPDRAGELWEDCIHEDLQNYCSRGCCSRIFSTTIVLVTNTEVWLHLLKNTQTLLNMFIHLQMCCHENNTKIKNTVKTLCNYGLLFDI
jgi:hypothetical protein